MQYCRIISKGNNNSVNFTCSREDNSATNDSMVMKIAHAQLHMYTNIMYKFQTSMCKTVGEKLQTKLCPRTDGRPWQFQYTPLHFVVGGGIMINGTKHKMMSLFSPFTTYVMSRLFCQIKWQTCRSRDCSGLFLYPD